MSSHGLIWVLVFLAVFVFAPLLWALCCSNDARRPKPSFRECPQCGAKNYLTQTQCYCCQHEFIPSTPIEATPTVIQRARQAGGHTAMQGMKAQVHEAEHARSTQR